MPRFWRNIVLLDPRAEESYNADQQVLWQELNAHHNSPANQKTRSRYRGGQRVGAVSKDQPPLIVLNSPSRRPRRYQYRQNGLGAGRDFQRCT
jgi:hypothetical protein